MRKQLEAYREVIEALEDKSQKNEQSYAKLEKILTEGGAKSGASTPSIQRTEALMRETLKEMAETRKLLIEVEDKAERANRTTNSLQKMQQDQAQKMARSTASYAEMLKRLKEAEHKQDDLSSQLEDTISQQAKMLRQIDKVAEDRARFMRKIERIEETVIQTRDALNAKAMVLLTDQADGLKSDETLGQALLRQNQEPAHIETAPVIAAEQIEAADARRKYIQMAAAGALLVGAVVTGWFLSEMNSPADTQVAAPAPFAQTTQIERPAQQQAQNWDVERDTSAFSQAESTPAAAGMVQDNLALQALDDIGTISVEDDQALAQLLETNPDAVATALNDIEPGTPQTPAALQTQEPAKPAFDPEKYTPVSKTGEIQPDASLPDVIKQVEEQAFAGSPEAQHDLAAIYTAGHAGVPRDYARAAFWFRKAADQGIANARYNLGVLYHQGLGVKPNMNEAIYWYNQASKLGHPEAQYNLGIAYIEGIGVTYSPQKAAENFEAAANGGVMEAAYNLGLIYENGLMGTPQPDQALLWYKRAADQGSPEAKAALEQLAKALNIKIEYVNRLVEGMQSSKESAAPQAKELPVSVVKTPVSVPQDTTEAINQAEPASADIMLESTEEEFAKITLAQIQEQLMRIGLYPGPADGVQGPLTSDAIRSYQSKNGLPVNGEASAELLSHMLSADADQEIRFQ